MQTEKLNTKIVTPVIRCSYPKLAQPDTQERGGKFGLSIPLPKSDKAACDALTEIMKNAAVNTWGEKYKNLGGVTSFVSDCDNDPELSEDEVYKGCLKFSAKSKKRPGIVFPNMEPVPTEEIEDVIYPGCWIRASITAYGTETGGKKTIAFWLNSVMFIKNGEALGGASNPKEDFAAYADSNWQRGDDAVQGDLF
jgi:hypothetical protein